MAKLAAGRESDTSASLARLYVGHAQVCLLKGDAKTASNHYREATRIYENVYAKFGPQKMGILPLANMASAYSGLTDILLKENDLKGAEDAVKRLTAIAKIIKDMAEQPKKPE